MQNINKYYEYRKKYLEFIDYYKKFTEKINLKLQDFNGEVYLFGAHIFSQYLISFGINQRKIKGILDNSQFKIGKRLYGTKFEVFHPNEIKNKKNIAVILKVASYKKEIQDQLSQINSSTVFFQIN